MSWPSAGLNGHVVNVATAFEEAQIVKIILAIDFSCQKPIRETPSCQCCDPNVKYIFFHTLWSCVGPNRLVNVVTAFQEAQIIKIMLVIDFLSQNSWQRYP